MKITSDLQCRSLIHAKGILFFVLGTLSGVLLFIQMPAISTAALLVITVWAFCRFYYYLFYVLERYLGRKKRFAGAIDAIRYLLFEASKTKSAQTPDDSGEDAASNDSR